MFTLISHMGYAGVFMYGYKVWETYKTQKSLKVESKKAFKNALMWPKYLWK